RARHGDEAAALPELGADLGTVGRGEPAHGLVVGLAVEAFVRVQVSVVVDEVDAVDRHERLLASARTSRPGRRHAYVDPSTARSCPRLSCGGAFGGLGR